MKLTIHVHDGKKSTVVAEKTFKSAHDHVRPAPVAVSEPTAGTEWVGASQAAVEAILNDAGKNPAESSTSEE